MGGGGGGGGGRRADILYMHGYGPYNLYTYAFEPISHKQMWTTTCLHVGDTLV